MGSPSFVGDRRRPRGSEFRLWLPNTIPPGPSNRRSLPGTTLHTTTPTRPLCAGRSLPVATRAQGPGGGCSAERNRPTPARPRPAHRPWPRRTCTRAGARAAGDKREQTRLRTVALRRPTTSRPARLLELLANTNTGGRRTSDRQKPEALGKAAQPLYQTLIRSRSSHPTGDVAWIHAICAAFAAYEGLSVSPPQHAGWVASSAIASSLRFRFRSRSLHSRPAQPAALPGLLRAESHPHPASQARKPQGRQRRRPHSARCRQAATCVLGPTGVGKSTLIVLHSTTSAMGGRRRRRPQRRPRHRPHPRRPRTTSRPARPWTCPPGLNVLEGATRPRHRPAGRDLPPRLRKVLGADDILRAALLTLLASDQKATTQTSPASRRRTLPQHRLGGLDDRRTGTVLGLVQGLGNPRKRPPVSTSPRLSAPVGARDRRPERSTINVEACSTKAASSSCVYLRNAR